MSRSNKIEIVNPAEKFFKWSGSTGQFEYYDKESKVNVEVPLPFKFVVLDTLSTIKGYSDANQSGYWSNEVRDLAIEPLTVWTKVNKKDIKKVAEGLYNDIKGDKAITGAKYCQSVYIAIGINKKLSLCNIQLQGTALSAWIEFNKSNDMYKGAIEVNSCIEGRKGATVYKTPVFTTIAITDVLDKQAKDMDKDTLKPYLKLYFDSKKTESVTE